MTRQSSPPPVSLKVSESKGGRNKKASMIGNDPLAWMKDEGDESAVSRKASAAAVSESLESRSNDERHVAQLEDSENLPQASTLESKDDSNNPDSSQDVGTALVLESSLGAAVVRKLYEGMKPLLEKNSYVEIDASRVETVDACGLQLLLGFISSAREQNMVVHWKQASAKFVEAAEHMDMKTHLGL